MNTLESREEEPVRFELCVVPGGWEKNQKSDTAVLAFPGRRRATVAALVGLDGSVEPG